MGFTGGNANLIFAGNGLEVITDTSAHAVSGFAVYFYEDSVISAITINSTGNSLASETLPAGTIIYGNIQSITLTSGACILYKS